MGDLGMHVRILTCILMDQTIRMWLGFCWLSMGSRGDAEMILCIEGDFWDIGPCGFIDDRRF